MNQFNVLIAEDDFRVSNIWSEFTERIPGFVVSHEARNGKDAFRFLNETPVDLIIMDIYMPEMDGVQLLHEIRKQDWPLEVIVISAAKEAAVIRRFIRLGVLDYIIKPCPFKRFKTGLTKFLDIQKQFESQQIEQAVLDAHFHGPILSNENSLRSLPKGLQQITLEKIIGVFMENPFAQSAEEIANLTGLSIATVQRYLRHLTNENELRKELTYGSKGRPEHKYSLN